ncbi:MAG: AraC family transcriptional regulator [Pseudomonadota bacterium]|nr:AraC family transcriptional regulator [Pseudomonadota bacterium]
MEEERSFPDRVLGGADAAEEMARILDAPPAVSSEVLRGETRFTRRWLHGGLHEYQRPMAAHVLVAYYGDDREMAVRVGKQRFAGKTRPGTFTIIPFGRDGQWDYEGPLEVSHVYLPDSRLQACADQLAGGRPVELLDRVGFADPAAARIMQMLSEEAVAPDPSSRLFVEQAIDLLCTQLVRGHSSFGALAPPAVRGGLADWQVKRVVAYMRERLDEEIGLDELAALVNLSRFHFCTAFRKATGRTPHQQLMLLRVGEARRLLTIPELPVTEIALAVGYQTPSAFAAAFRKVTGATPTDFRKGL